VVSGNVQGVFFRDSTRDHARQEGVDGWITNRDDGAVEAVFEGPPRAVDALVEFCRHGPASADVHDVEVSEETPAGLESFDVR
jgi:acylphosphatase